MLDVLLKDGRLKRWGLPIGLLVVVGVVATLLIGRKPAAPLPPPPPPQTLVDSFASGAYSLGDWAINDALYAGWIDTVTVEPGGSHQVSRDDQMLLATGWAGEGTVGLRVPTVILTLCDTVVAATPVKNSRPDVAAKIHPNLGESGWQARLLVGHLPRCEGTYLEAWAIYPDGTVLLPLGGRVRVNLPPRDAAVVLSGFAGSPPLRPDPTARPKTVTVDADSTLILKRRPSADGPVVNRYSPGRYTAYRLDEREAWVLLAIDGQIGWVSREAVRIAN